MDYCGTLIDSDEIREWVIALGTIGAAVFAGWAAFSASSSARKTHDIVDIERTRDAERAEAARTAQAKRVVIDLQTVTLYAGPEAAEHVGVDLKLMVTNSSDTPIFKVRLKVQAGAAVWGPQLIGNIRPGQEIELYARIYTAADLADTDAFVRFVDANDRAWVGTARGPVTPDSDDPSRWIDDGRAWAESPKDSFELGQLNGVAMADFDDWYEFVRQHDEGEE